MKTTQLPIIEHSARKIFTVNLNGTKPFRADKTIALAWLWTSRVEGEKCSIYTALDPGLVHADNLKLSDFPKSGPTRDKALDLFRSAEQSRVHGILIELCQCFQGDVRDMQATDDRTDCLQWNCHDGFEIQFFVVKSDFVLNRKLHTYEVVVSGAGDADVDYSGTSLREACQAFYGAVSRAHFRYSFNVMRKEGEAF